MTNQQMPLETRLGFALIGIIAGNVPLLIFCLLIRNGGFGFFALFAIFGSIPGWILVGIPIALTFPTRLLANAWWPIACLFIGAALGPLALLIVFIVFSALAGDFKNFSLANAEVYWPLSILVSTVSFLVYAALLRQRSVEQEL